MNLQVGEIPSNGKLPRLDTASCALRMIIFLLLEWSEEFVLISVFTLDYSSRDLFKLKFTSPRVGKAKALKALSGHTTENARLVIRMG